MRTFHWSSRSELKTCLRTSQYCPANCDVKVSKNIKTRPKISRAVYRKEDNVKQQGNELEERKKRMVKMVYEGAEGGLYQAQERIKCNSEGKKQNEMKLSSAEQQKHNDVPVICLRDLFWHERKEYPLSRRYKVVEFQITRFIRRAQNLVFIG